MNDQAMATAAGERVRKRVSKQGCMQVDGQVMAFNLDHEEQIGTGARAVPEIVRPRPSAPSTFIWPRRDCAKVRCADVCHLAWCPF
jgi:hypothetical protein